MGGLWWRFITTSFRASSPAECLGWLFCRFRSQKLAFGRTTTELVMLFLRRPLVLVIGVLIGRENGLTLYFLLILEARGAIFIVE